MSDAKKPPHTFARVWTWVKKVPRGRVVTYGQLSQLIDKRLSPVGVGWAMSAAPKGVPWQRVVNARGGISTRDPRQRALLEQEGVEFGIDDCVPLGTYQWKPRGKPRAPSRNQSSAPAPAPAPARRRSKST